MKLSEHEISKQWHPTKNEKSPKDFKKNSHKKVWWLGSCGHEWEAIIKNRTSREDGCPYCSGKKVNKDNCLTYKFPEIAKEWHPTKNDLKPTDLTSSSNKKVWWLCPKCKNEWQTTPNKRTNQNRGCPYCCGQKTHKYNSLTHLYPELAKEWHPTKNNLSPEEVTSGSGKVVWWFKKSCGHEWQAQIKSRRNGNGCPYCSNQKVDPKKSLGALFPELTKEWHPIKNSITPFDVPPSAHRKTWWLGSCGHEWESFIFNRSRGIGCPFCKISKGEKIVKQFLGKNEIFYEQQKRFNNCKFKLPLPFDFYIKIDDKIGLIEFQGEQHFEVVNYFGEDNFKECIIRDSIKFEYCKKHNIPLLRIPYYYENIENLLTRFISSIKDNCEFYFNPYIDELSNILEQSELLNENTIKTENLTIQILPIENKIKYDKADLSFFSIEWLTKKELCKNLIYSSLGKNKKIHARNCTVKILDNLTFKQFCNKYHFQGANNLGKYFVGLHYKDDLVGGMSLGRHHRINDSNLLILDRLCFKYGTSVVGGASKLFKLCKSWAKENGYSKIISWSDNRFGKGKVYEKMGFKLKKEIPATHFYVDLENFCILSKQSQKKSNTKCPNNKTESQFAAEHKLIKLMDCGKKRWVVDLDFPK